MHWRGQKPAQREIKRWIYIACTVVSVIYMVTSKDLRRETDCLVRFDRYNRWLGERLGALSPICTPTVRHRYRLVKWPILFPFHSFLNTTVFALVYIGESLSSCSSIEEIILFVFPLNPREIIFFQVKGLRHAVTSLCWNTRAIFPPRSTSSYFLETQGLLRSLWSSISLEC